MPPVRYQSYEEDSARWSGFPFRDGDIVISTRSKSGTTWMQMICALLVFQTPRAARRRCGELSPWLDWLAMPREEVFARLAAQPHRRFIKTHTPLDGIPVDPRATYIVVARHPLDMAVSLYHQGNNIDRARVRRLTGQPEPAEPPPPRPPLHDWLIGWIHEDTTPQQQMDSLPGVMWHLADAWARRDQPNIVLVHYDDLSADLGGRDAPPGERLGDHRARRRLARAGRRRPRSSRCGTAPTGSIGPPGHPEGAARLLPARHLGAGREELSAAELAGYQSGRPSWPRRTC